MQFGEWKITGSAIEWNGKGPDRFVIDRSMLLETILHESSFLPMYKWLVLATEEDWLTEDDLYDLNFAFVFAAGASGEEFDYEIFDNTVEYQYELLDDEDEDEEDEF